MSFCTRGTKTGTSIMCLILLYPSLPCSSISSEHSPDWGLVIGLCFLLPQGANQAVAAARLLQGSPRNVRFVCRFGDDAYADILERELVTNGVDVSGCRKVAGTPSGHGMVMLEPDGAASSVVLGGSNLAWQEVGQHSKLQQTRNANTV